MEITAGGGAYRTIDATYRYVWIKLVYRAGRGSQEQTDADVCSRQ